jgi:hypothetical protein
MNCKDPEIAEKIADRLMSDVVNREEIVDLETLFMNHRLRMAADLDLFDELERHLEAETRLIENKNDRLSRMSMTMSQMTQILDSKIINPESRGSEFEGFVTRGSDKQTQLSTIANSKLNPDRLTKPNFSPNSFESGFADVVFEQKNKAINTSKSY